MTRNSGRYAAPLLWAACAACSGAGNKTADAPRPAPPAANEPQSPLPTKPFAAPQPWSPPRGGGNTFEPPAVTGLTWYVQVEQYEPRQKPAPEWQPLPPTDTVEIKMPAGSRYRCIAPPLTIDPEPDESGNTLEAWSLAREVLCSADGFKTFSAHPYRMHVEPGGKSARDYGSEGWLRERAADGSILHTVLSVSPESPRREATQGPPRILTQKR